MTDKSTPQIIAIIGAGIAGPVFALAILSNPALRQRYTPIIYERSPCSIPSAFSPLSPGDDKRHDGDSRARTLGERGFATGAAVALTSNALYPLYSLGLQDPLNAISCETDHIKIWRAWGREQDSQGKFPNQLNNPNWQEDLGTGMRMVDRQDLQRLVLERVRELGGRVYWGMKLNGMTTMEGGGVTLSFDGGREVSAALVVGADGVWSYVRRQVVASKVEDVDERWSPEFSGLDAIYGVTRRTKNPQGSENVAKEDKKELEGGDTHWLLHNSGIASTWPLPEGRQFWTISFYSRTPPAKTLTIDEPHKRGDGKLYAADTTLGGYGLQETAQILKHYENIWHPVEGNFGELFRKSERKIGRAHV